jgi:hypothetical protein
MPTITFPTDDLAEFVAEIFAGGYRTFPGDNERYGVSAEGGTVTLDDDALAHLAHLSEETDGHYDGTHVWISGDGYPVVDPRNPGQ